MKRLSLCTLWLSASLCSADLLDSASISAVNAQLNSANWAAANLIDRNHSTRWLSGKQANDINFIVGAANGAACFNSIDLVNYGADNRSIRRFALFRTMDTGLQSDTGTAGWIPVVANANPSGLIDHLNWAQGARLIAIDSQLNATNWAAEHVNDGDSASLWLSGKSNNVLEYAFDTDWDGNTGDAITVEQIVLSNYGADDRSLHTFQVEVTTDGTSWRKLEVPGSVAGAADFNFSLLWHGAQLSDIDSQLNSTNWGADNIHDGDTNSIWLSNKSNNALSFVFDVDNDSSTGAAGDADDAFTIETIYLQNYGIDDRSVNEFQIEYKTGANNNWQKIPVPGSAAGEQDFNFALALHGGRLIAINSQLNSTNWGADNIHDGDVNSIWLSGRGNNTLDFAFDVDGDGSTSADGDNDDLFTLEKIYLRNYGVDDRAVRQFQVEVRTRANTAWHKLAVPGSGAGQPGYNFAMSAQGGRLDVIDSQLNATNWSAHNLHDGDVNSIWLSNKPTNTLVFSFDTDLDGNTGDGINLDTIALTNYGDNDRSVQTFEMDIQIAGGPWQAVNAPGGGTVFTATMNSNGQSWSVGSFTHVTAARIRTLSNHGDPSYTGARELVFSGTSVAANYTFTAAMHANGETFTFSAGNRPVDVTGVRFRSINNHGDQRYVGAREFAVQGTSITRNYTFNAAMHANGETFVLDTPDRPVDVTEVRLLTISNHGDQNYTGIREFAVLGPSITPQYTFSVPMSTGPHTIALDSEDHASGVTGVRLRTIANHGDQNYTGLREFSLLGTAVGPGYIFEAQMDSSTQTFNFPSALGTVFRLHTLSNHGDLHYTGAAELYLNASNSCTFGQWQMDELQWTPGAQTRDASGNNLHATAFNGVSTAQTNPAISGDPGTCRYGNFDGQDDHLAISPAFPDLQNSFTITAWIYARDVSGDLRIFADDENNAGGYALSLGDAGNGRLRFFSRGVSPVSVDTAAVISANTWYFVAAVHDSVTSTRQIYVNGVAQTLTGASTAPTYSGNWSTDSGRASIGGETNNAGENNANFRFNGHIDELTVYSGALTQSEIVALQAQTHACASSSSLSHFRIDTGSAGASTCVPKTISVAACATPDCSSTLTNYTGNVTLSTSSGHGNWSSAGAGVLSPAPDNDDNGHTSYTFASADNGVVTFQLNNTHAESLTVTVADNATAVSHTSSTVTFADNVFVISNDPLQIAGRPQTMLAALWTHDGTNCAIATGYRGQKNLKAWLTRSAGDPGGAAPEIGALSLPDTVPGSDNLTTLHFTNGTTQFTLNSSDVGQYALNLRDDSLQFADTVVDGNSVITTRPFGFHIDITSSTNPGASDATGPVFLAAGNHFTVAASAVRWQANDDNNSDGVPDGHDDNNPANNADLSDNPVTASFGAEQNGHSERIILSGFAVLPGGGIFDDSANPGNAPVISRFSNGTGNSTTARYSEVGIIEINASLVDGNYLNSDNVMGASGYIGRFTPDHFILQAPVFTSAGAGYTYLGQTFTGSYDIVAVNASGDITRNYSADFLKLSAAYLDSNADYGAVDQSAATFMDARTSASGHVLSDNAGVVTVASVDLAIAKTTHIEAPLSSVQIGLNLSDSDAVAVTTPNLDTTGDAISDKVTVGSLPGQLRYGRVYIAPVYGPETPAFNVSTQPDALIVMPFDIQYFDGNQFIVNHDDNASTYNNWQWTLSNHCRDGSLSCGALPANFVVNLPATPATVSQGRAANALPVTITRPGLAGDVRLGLGVDSWLQFDWDHNGSDDDPDAQITFGTYRGHDRIIYWREKQH